MKAIDISRYTSQKCYAFLASPTMFLGNSQIYLNINHIVYK